MYVPYIQLLKMFKGPDYSLWLAGYLVPDFTRMGWNVFHNTVIWKNVHGFESR